MGSRPLGGIPGKLIRSPTSSQLQWSEREQCCKVLDVLWPFPLWSGLLWETDVLEDPQEEHCLALGATTCIASWRKRHVITQDCGLAPGLWPVRIWVPSAVSQPPASPRWPSLYPCPWDGQLDVEWRPCGYSLWFPCSSVASSEPPPGTQTPSQASLGSWGGQLYRARVCLYAPLPLSSAQTSRVPCIVCQGPSVPSDLLEQKR